MRTATDTQTLEHWMDGAAATAFMAATAFALAKLAPQLGVAIVGISVLALAGCWGALQLVARERHWRVPSFDLVDCDSDAGEEELAELVLTLEQVVHPAAAPEGDELLLDDILGAVRPDSRVVRLFAPGELPTPGQLKISIDRHLQSRTGPPPIPDATQALSEALAELRRSLR